MEMNFLFPILDTYVRNENDPNDQEEWRAWRQTLLSVPASSFADWLGHGYSSRAKRIRCLRKEEEETFDGYARVAMAHGEKFEWPAINAVVRLLQGQYEVHQHQQPINPTYVVSLGEEDYCVALTMDLILDVPDKNGAYRPVEIKCPFYRVKALGIEEAFKEMLTGKHARYGRCNAFVQAAVYATLSKAPSFFTCFYFTDDSTHEGLILYEFKCTVELMRWVIHELRAFAKQVKLADITHLRTPCVTKQLALDMQAACFVKRTIVEPHFNSFYS